MTTATTLLVQAERLCERLNNRYNTAIYHNDPRSRKVQRLDRIYWRAYDRYVRRELAATAAAEPTPTTTIDTVAAATKEAPAMPIYIRIAQRNGKTIYIIHIGMSYFTRTYTRLASVRLCVAPLLNDGHTIIEGQDIYDAAVTKEPRP